MQFQVDQQALAAVFSLPAVDGCFDGEFLAYLSMLGAARAVVLLTFPPKCAGTFLRSAAVLATGGQLVRAVHAQGGREGQLYLPLFVRYYLGGVCEGPMVSHVHMQASPGNRNFIDALGLRPAIMLRAIPDMLASLLDMFLQGDKAAASRRENVNCDVPEDFPALDRARQTDFMIDMIGPWYVSYYATWREYARAARGRVLVLHYDDFKRDAAASLQQMLDHAGIARDRAACQAAVDAAWGERGEHRFNKGVSGRGQVYFSDAQRGRLARVFDYYPELKAWRDELL